MSNENNSNEFHPIDEPVGVSVDSGRDIVGWLSSAVVIIGGLYLFPSTIMPRRTMGATISSNIQWQQRQAVARAAVTQAQAQAPTAGEKATLPPPQKPVQ